MQQEVHAKHCLKELFVETRVITDSGGLELSQFGC